MTLAVLTLDKDGTTARGDARHRLTPHARDRDKYATCR